MLITTGFQKLEMHLLALNLFWFHDTLQDALTFRFFSFVILTQNIIEVLLFTFLFFLEAFKNIDELLIRFGGIQNAVELIGFRFWLAVVIWLTENVREYFFLEGFAEVVGVGRGGLVLRDHEEINLYKVNRLHN